MTDGSNFRSRSSPPRRLGLCIATAALALVALAPAPAAGAETQTAECANLSSCTSLPNTPWVAIPAAQRGYDEENKILFQAGTVRWRLECPLTEVPAGRDFRVQGAQEEMTVTAFLPPFNTGITGSPFAFFFGYSEAGEPNSFQPLVGCIPKQASRAARVAAPSGQTVRTVTRTLHPGQDKTFAHRCARGEQLIGSAHGVGFYEKGQPSRRELRELDVERVERRGKVLVHARTGAGVGDDEKVELQLHATCR